MMATILILMTTFFLMVSASMAISCYNAIGQVQDLADEETSTRQDIADKLDESALLLKGSWGWSILVLVVSLLVLGGGAGWFIYERVKMANQNN